MATLREALRKAKQEPGSQRAAQLLKAIASGTFDQQAMQEGIDLSGMKKKMGVDVGVAGGVVAPVISKTIGNKIEEKQINDVKQQIEEKVPFAGGVIAEAAPKAAKEQEIKGTLKDAASPMGPTIKEVPIAIGEELAKVGLGIRELPTPMSVITNKILPEVEMESYEDSAKAVEEFANMVREKTGAEKNQVVDTLAKIGVLLAPGIGGAKGASVATKALGGGGKLQFLAGSLGSTAGVSQAAEGRMPTLEEATTGLGIDLLTGGASKLFSYLKPNLVKNAEFTPKIIKQAQKAGLDDKTIKNLVIKDAADEKTAKELLDVALKKLKQGDISPSGTGLQLRPLDVVAEQLENVQTGLRGQINTVGGMIESAITAAPKVSKTVSMSKAKNELMKSLKKNNVKVTSGGLLDFTDSRFKRSTGDQNLIQSAYDFAQKGDVGVFETVQEYRSLGDALYQGKAKQEITGAADAMVAKFRKLIQEPVLKLGGNLGKLNKQYSQLVDLDHRMKKFFGPDITQSPMVFRRLMGNAASAKKLNDILEDVHEFSVEMGLKEGERLAKKVGIATALENALELAPPTSFEGIVKTGLKQGPMAATIDFVVDKLATKPEKVQAVKELLETTIQEKDMIKKAILPQLESVTPDIAQALRAILIEGVEEETQENQAKD